MRCAQLVARSPLSFLKMCCPLALARVPKTEAKKTTIVNVTDVPRPTAPLNQKNKKKKKDTPVQSWLIDLELGEVNLELSHVLSLPIVRSLYHIIKDPKRPKQLLQFMLIFVLFCFCF
jgi:hypothetical protein